MSKRLYSLDVLKLGMACVVALFHLGVSLKLTAGVCVDIFFMISGFFLGRRYYTRAGKETAWDFTLDHAKSVYPHYFLSLAVLFTYLLVRSVLYWVLSPSVEGFVKILGDFYNEIPDLVFLQSSFTFHDGLNYPAWQISALLIGGYFVYALLCWNEPVSRRILFPAAILMTKSLTYGAPDLFGNAGPIYLPLARAFAPLCVGMLTWWFWDNGGREWIAEYEIALNLGSLAAIAGLLLFGSKAEIYWITMPLVILMCQWEPSWLNKLLNHACFRYCGQWSLAVYLNHALIERIVKALLLPRLERMGHPLTMPQTAALYLALLLPYSVLTAALVRRWKMKK